VDLVEQCYQFHLRGDDISNFYRNNETSLVQQKIERIQSTVLELSVTNNGSIQRSTAAPVNVVLSRGRNACNGAMYRCPRKSTALLSGLTSPYKEHTLEIPDPTFR